MRRPFWRYMRILGCEVLAGHKTTVCNKCGVMWEFVPTLFVTRYLDNYHQCSQETRRLISSSESFGVPRHRDSGCRGWFDVLETPDD